MGRSEVVSSGRRTGGWDPRKTERHENRLYSVANEGRQWSEEEHRDDKGPFYLSTGPRPTVLERRYQ